MLALPALTSVQSLRNLCVGCSKVLCFAHRTTDHARARVHLENHNNNNINNNNNNNDNDDDDENDDSNRIIMIIIILLIKV